MTSFVLATGLTTAAGLPTWVPAWLHAPLEFLTATYVLVLITVLVLIALGWAGFSRRPGPPFIELSRFDHSRLTREAQARSVDLSTCITHLMNEGNRRRALVGDLRRFQGGAILLDFELGNLRGYSVHGFRRELASLHDVIDSLLNDLDPDFPTITAA